MAYTITFRTDASITIGTGHVMRCLTLADALTKQGAKCQFWCSEQTPVIVPKLANSDYERGDAPQTSDLLIIDHYGLDKAFERVQADRYPKVMVIDDLPRHHHCHILLDQTLGRTKEQWQEWLPPDTLLLLGTEYLLLRDEFEAKRKDCKPRQQIHTILVALGGTDPDNITSMVLDALYHTSATIKVVMGGQAPHLQQIKRQAQSMPNVELLVDCNTMADLMCQADLAIGAGGTTAWERCALGLPTILLQIADNQTDVILQLVKAGAALACPLAPSSLRQMVSEMDAETLQTLSLNALRVSPGHGADRTAQIILHSMSPSS